MVVCPLDHVPGHPRGHTKEPAGIVALSCHARFKFCDILVCLVFGYGECDLIFFESCSFDQILSTGPALHGLETNR